MKIAFYNIIGETKNAEQETLVRLQYVLSELGHELYITDREGYVVNECANKGQHVEQIGIDFLFTYNCLELGLIVLPNCFSVFLHWAPVGFFENYKSLLYLKSFNLYDAFACTYEKQIFGRVTQIPVCNIPMLGSSVPAEFAIPPQRLKKRKLFYTGINFERKLNKMRYTELLTELDRTGNLQIYGPSEVYSHKGLWSGFRSYRGEIPFDGRSILEKISEAGVCLALNSPMHNDADGVSNRTYEGTAAGAVIISDNNAFVRKYFGDSVFYIDRGMSEKDASKRILEILNWVNEHPEEAYQMACRSQKVFLEHLTLDKMVADFVASTKEAISRMHDKTLQTDVIDVICFADKAEDFPSILSQLERQYYQNLHLIVVTDEEVYKELEVPYPNDFVQWDRDFKGRAFIRAKEIMRGQCFMFLDKYSVLHSRHIYKNWEVLSERDELFVYSGSYLKKYTSKGKKYIVLNNKPILRDEFLLFSHASNENTDWYYRDQQCFHIETIFARSAALFKRKILDYTTDEELEILSEAVHFYLACCSLVKANKPGWFTHALTTGYSGDSVEGMSRKVFGYNRRHWYSNNRSAKTYIKELNEIFFKYCFESNPNNVLPRNFNGEVTWSDEISRQYTLPLGLQISSNGKFFRWLKRVIPVPMKEKIKRRLHTNVDVYHARE